MDLTQIQQRAVTARKKEKEVQEQSKIVRNELSNLKVHLLSAMQAQDVGFIPMGDKLVAVRRAKFHRPQVDSDLVTVALRIHARNHSIQLTDEFCQSLWTVIVECQQKMCTGKEVVEFQESLPMASLY